MNYKVSVVIPFYDNVEWLKEAIDSVIQQNYKNIEIIVINDGSKENIDDFLIHYSKYFVYIYKQNGGPGSARNLGINRSTGDFIAFLDSDDIWAQNKIEKQLDFMIQNNYIWSHTGYAYFNNGSNIIFNKNFIPNNHGYAFKKLLISFKCATPSLMVRSTVLKENRTLRFAEDMRFGQDIYFMLKMSEQYPIYILPEILVFIRLRGKNAAGSAKTRLQISSQLYKYFKSNEKYYFNKQKVDKAIQLILLFEVFGNNIVKYFEKKITRNKLFLEWLSRILFVIPFSLKRIYIKFIC